MGYLVAGVLGHNTRQGTAGRNSLVKLTIDIIYSICNSFVDSSVFGDGILKRGGVPVSAPHNEFRANTLVA